MQPVSGCGTPSGSFPQNLKERNPYVTAFEIFLQKKLAKFLNLAY